jgi:16S rRNA (cytosine967-C5)-methyltransferase
VPAHAAIGETVGCADKLKKPWAKACSTPCCAAPSAKAKRCWRAGTRPGGAYRALAAKIPESLLAEQWEAICAANNAHPPMILRVNRRHHSRDAYLGNADRGGHRRHAVRLQPRWHRPRAATDVRSLPGFAEGWISVQDEAAQLAADLLDLAPGQRVLDACCAPAARPATSSRSRPCRCGGRRPGSQAPGARAENLERLGLSAELIAADGRDTATWWDGKPFQRILLDAPCSATGVIRRHPDIKLTRQPDDIAALAVLQGELLDALWKTLEVGGILLYATCSTLPTENTEVIEAFLARTRGARELDLATAAGSSSPTVANCWPRRRPRWLLLRQADQDRRRALNGFKE